MVVTRIELPKHLNGELYYGDNLELLKSLSSASVDLAYFDSPFFSGRNYTSKSKVDDGEVRKFDDTFHGNIKEFINYLGIRIQETKRVLKQTGSIYVHLDWHAVSDVKIFIMDKLFGRDNFRNHIV